MSDHKRETGRILALLASTVNTCSLYSRKHQFALESAEKLRSIIEKNRNRPTKIMLVEDDLIVNEAMVRDPGIHGTNLMKKMKRRGISGIVIHPEVTTRELLDLAETLSSPIEKPLKSPHIKIGKTTVAFRPDEEKSPEGEESAAQAQSRRKLLTLVKESLGSISPFQKMNVHGLEELVVNFILSFKREASVLKLLTPVRSYSEFTYTHATNVAILTLFQAQSLGIGGRFLHEIGIAALLHDVGKLFIPGEILEKKGRLTDEEFKMITNHTVYGAQYLSQVEGLTQLAPIVAYEHHMRYDGEGYPYGRKYRKKQNLISQIVQISDFFDALRSRRPYKKDWKVGEILSLMKSNAGKEFNPELVENFSEALLRTIS